MKRVRFLTAGLVTLAIAASQVPFSSFNVWQSLAPSADAQAATPALSITLSDPAGAPQPGGILRYSVRFTNNTSVVARNVRFGGQDPVNPTAGYKISESLVHTATGFPNCTFATAPGAAGYRILSCGPLEKIDPGQFYEFIIQFNVKDTAPCDELISLAIDVTADGFAGTWSRIAQTRLACAPTGADVSVSKTGPATVVRGGTVSYAVTAHNAGPATATNVVVSDVIPSGLTFNAAASSAGCVLNGNGTSVLCNNFNLNSGESKSFTIAFTVPTIANCTTSTIQNTATVSSSSTDPSSSNNTSQTVSTTATCPVVLQPVLSVQKTGPATVERGSSVAYTVTVANTGAGAAQNFVLTDVVPDALVYRSADSNANNPSVCTQQNAAGTFQNVVCAPITVQPGQTLSYRFAFDVPTTVRCSEQLSDRAEYHADNVLSAVTGVVTTTVTCPVPLNGCIDIIKETFNAQGSPIPIGNEQFTFRLDNATPKQSGLDGRVRFDNVSPGWHTVSEDARAGWSVITANPAQVLVQAGDNCAVLAFKNRQDTPTGADVSVSKTGPATVVRGGTVSYAVTAHNAGPATATNVVVSDVIPSGLTFNAAASSAGCVLNGNGTSVLCNNFNLNSGESKSFTIAFTVPTIANCTTSTIQNTATVSSSSTDPSSSNNTSQTVSTTATCPVVQVDNGTCEIIGDFPASIQVNQPFQVRFRLTNTGTNPWPAAGATRVTLASNNPANNTRWGTSRLNLTSDVAPGGSVTFDATLTAPGTAQDQAPFEWQLLRENGARFGTACVRTLSVVPGNTSAVTVTKSAPATIRPGDKITFDIVVRNTTTQTLTDVRMGDPIDSFTTQLTFLPNESSSRTHPEVRCTKAAGQPVWCVKADGLGITLAPGALAIYGLTFQVPANAACGSTISNAADIHIGGGAASNWTNTTRTVVDCSTQQADLAMMKTGPSTIERGRVLLYSLWAVHVSGITATNIVVTDPVPAGLTFDPANSSPACTLVANTVRCTASSLTHAEDKRGFDVAFFVPTTYQCNGTISNTATVTATQTDPNSANNTQNPPVLTTVTCPTPITADLSVTKTGPTQVTRGGTISYSLTATNAGPARATGVIVRDLFPAEFTFNADASDAACVLVGAEVKCMNFDLDAGQSRTFTVVFNVPTIAGCANITVQNNAIVMMGAASGITDPNSGNNQSQPVTTSVLCPTPTTADLVVIKQGPATAVRGQTLAYTVTVANGGPATATNVVVSDVVPAGLTFNAAQSSQGCALNGAGNTVLCTGFDLAVGAGRTFTLVFNAPLIDNCQASSVSNVATVSSSLSDPTSSNNTSTTVVTQLTCPVPTTTTLTIQKTASATAARGSTLTYTLTVQNTGTVAAQNVVVRDPIPLGLAYSAAGSDGTCVVENGAAVCRVGTVAAGQARVVQLAFSVPTVDPCTTSQVSNIAFVTSDQSVIAQSATVATTLQCPTPTTADLSVTKTGQTTAIAGGTISYSLTATNAGPARATGVIVRDPIPSGLTFNAAASDPACLVVGTDVKCMNFDLDAGQSRTFSVVFTVAVPAACTPFTVQNSASILLGAAGGVTDPNSNNNQSQTVITSVSCPTPNTADVSVTKTGPATMERGGTLSYTVTAVNAGPATATNVVIADVIPSGLTFNAAASSAGCVLNGAGTSVLCNNFSLGLGESKSFTIAFTVPAVAACLTQTVQNVATVSTSVTDPNTSNNTSQTVSTTITCPVPTTADLSLVKTGPATAVRGSTINYTLTVSNLGGASAENVRVTDPVPAGLTFVPAQSSASCSLQGNAVVCTHPLLGANQSQAFSLVFSVATISGCSAGTVQNTATVTSDRTDPSSGNNSSTVSTTLICPVVSFTIQKTDNRVTAQPNEVLAYVITVTNTSATAVSDITVSDVLPAQLAFVSADGGTANGQLVTWSNQSFTLGQTRTYTVQARVSATAPNGTVLSNTAAVNGGASAVDNTTVDNPVAQTGCVEVVKEAYSTGGALLNPQPQQFEFRLGAQTAFSNTTTGRATFQNVPVGARVVTETLPSGWTQLSSTPAGGAVTVVAGSSCAVVVFRNQQTQTQQPTFTVTKTDNRTSAGPNETLVYSITVQNTSSVNAQNATVTDTLSSLVSYLSSSPNATVSGQTVTWSNLFIPANGSVILTVSTLVSSTATNGAVITNTATVNNAASGTDTTVVQVGGTGNVTIDVTDSPDPVEACDTLTYTVRVTNPSNSTQNVNVTQVLPSDVDFLSATDGGTHSNGVITWSNVSLSSNQTRTFTVQVRVDCDVADGRSITTTVYAGGATDTESTRVESDDNDDDEDIRLDITDTPDPAEPGETVTYTISIRNDDDSSRSVDLDVTLDDDLEFISASDDCDEEDDGEIRCENIFISRNSTEFVTVRARVSDDARDGDQLEVTAEVDDEEAREITRVIDDGDDDDNVLATLFLTKQSDRTEAGPGEDVYFSITIRNVSNAIARNVVVVDNFVSSRMSVAEVGAGLVSGDRITWSIGQLSPNETRTFTYRGKLSPNLAHGDDVLNTVQASGENLSAIPRASVNIRVSRNQPLPPTGLTDNTGPLENTGRFLRPLGGTAAATPAVMWTSLALMGVAVGGRFGRRYFL